MDNFDICVIGAGPAGIAAAMRAWDFGKRVCIIERKCLGGAGLHNGALSSKTLWELSRDYRNAIRQDRGYKTGEYRKVFAGLEDNEHLSEIMAEMRDTPIFELADELYSRLAARYDASA